MLVQLAAVGLGGFGAWALSRRAGLVLRNGWSIAIVMGGSLALLLAVQVIGREVNARRWLDLGPIKLQPSEIAKLALIAVTAWYLTRVQEKVRLDMERRAGAVISLRCLCGAGV